LLVSAYPFVTQWLLSYSVIMWKVPGRIPRDFPRLDYQRIFPCIPQLLLHSAPEWQVVKCLYGNGLPPSLKHCLFILNSILYLCHSLKLHGQGAVSKHDKAGAATSTWRMDVAQCPTQRCNSNWQLSVLGAC